MRTIALLMINVAMMMLMAVTIVMRGMLGVMKVSSSHAFTSLRLKDDSDNINNSDDASMHSGGNVPDLNPSALQLPFSSLRHTSVVEMWHGEALGWQRVRFIGWESWSCSFRVAFCIGCIYRSWDERHGVYDVCCSFCWGRAARVLQDQHNELQPGVLSVPGLRQQQ